MTFRVIGKPTSTLRLGEVRAGEWKRRRQQVNDRREQTESMAPVRAASELIRFQADRRKALADRVSAAEGVVEAVKVEIATTKARLSDLKSVELPAAEQAVVAAREALASLDGDVARAEALMGAQAILNEDTGK